METTIQEHRHNGIGDQKINLLDLVGSIKTITVATELTKKLTSKPAIFIEQVFIDSTTGTKKLYIYDMVGGVWRSCTIA